MFIFSLTPAWTGYWPILYFRIWLVTRKENNKIESDQPSYKISMTYLSVSQVNVCPNRARKSK